MKIIRVNHSIGNIPLRVYDTLNVSKAPSPDILPVSLLPDSATVNRGRPVFIPDFVDENWRLTIVPMFRIGRLGKFVEPRFAYRYIDGVALGATLVAPEINPNLHQHDAPNFRYPSALAAAFDGCLSMGSFLDLNTEYSPLLHEGALAVTLTSPVARKSPEIAGNEIHIFDILSLISRFCTLRTGDIIIPGFVPDIDVIPLIDTHIAADATLGTLQLPKLSFNLK